MCLWPSATIRQTKRLQRRLGITTVYVTHDQTEAMTLGDRVAVLRKGMLQQVATPRELYDSPVNMFVAGFIGSPPMNFAPGEVEGDRLRLPFVTVSLDEERAAAVAGKSLVMAGIRPGDFEDARAWGASFIPARAVHEHGIAAVIDAVPPGSQVIVTFDCDGLDPSIMPAVIGPAPGGLTYWQSIGILHGIAAKARLAAFDIVEFVPERDVAGLGALTAARIVANVLGLAARQAN